MTIMEHFHSRASPRLFKLTLTSTLLCFVAVHLVEIIFLRVLVTKRQHFPPPYLPDFCWKGYTPNELATWYTAIGEQGRFVYLIINMLDFGIIMPSYFVMLQTGLALTKNPLTMHYLPLLVVTCDLTETLVFLTASLMYPKVLDDWIIQVASVATQIKFVPFLLSVVGILYYHVLGNANKKSPTVQKKKD